MGTDISYAADRGHVSPGCANCFRAGHTWRSCPERAAEIRRDHRTEWVRFRGYSGGER